MRTAGLLYAQSASAQMAYHLDSVKVTSSCKFEHAAPAALQTYTRILYPVFGDNQLNSEIRRAMLLPVRVKYPFKNSLAA